MNESEDIGSYVAAFQRGEEKGFTYFFKELYPAVLYFAFRILKNKPLAEDIVEESFIKIWDIHSLFRHHQLIKSWLYTVTRTACIQKLREQGNIDKAERLQKAGNEAINEIIVAEVITEVHTTIEILPPVYRKIFEMLYIQGKTVKEIAVETGDSIPAIKNKKVIGLQLLRERFPDLVA